MSRALLRTSPTLNHTRRIFWLTTTPFKKLCLTSPDHQEYIYDPVDGFLKAYEKHDARFLLHLLLRGDCRAHFT